MAKRGTIGTQEQMEVDWDKFCQIVVERWQKKMMDKDIYDTGALYQSIVYNYRGVNAMNQTVMRGNAIKAGTIPDFISFSFLKYGIYVEHGVGRGYTKGNTGLVKFQGKGRGRERRTWFYRIFANERHRLGELVGKMYGEAARSMIHTIDASYDRNSGSHQTRLVRPVEVLRDIKW